MRHSNAHCDQGCWSTLRDATWNPHYIKLICFWVVLVVTRCFIWKIWSAKLELKPYIFILRKILKRATSLDKIILTTSCNSKCAFYGYLSTHSSTRVHLSKCGNVNLTRQLAQHQGPTEPKHLNNLCSNLELLAITCTSIMLYLSRRTFSLII